MTDTPTPGLPAPEISAQSQPDEPQTEQNQAAQGLAPGAPGLPPPGRAATRTS